MSELHTMSTVHPAGYRELRPEEATQHLAALHLVDVREPDEFAGPLGRIAGAELVPLGTLPGAASAWERNGATLVICRSGNRSGKAAAALAQQGFTEVYNLVGGMLRWNELGFPVERA